MDEHVSRVTAALHELDAAVAATRGVISPGELAAAVGVPESFIYDSLARTAPANVKVTEAARRLNASRATVYRLLESNQLEPVISGPATTVAEDSLEALIAAMERTVQEASVDNKIRLAYPPPGILPGLNFPVSRSSTSPALTVKEAKSFSRRHCVTPSAGALTGVGKIVLQCSEARRTAVASRLARSRLDARSPGQRRG